MRRRAAWRYGLGGTAARVLRVAAILLIVTVPGVLSAESSGGAAELFRLGVEAMRSGRYADAASMFRLSHDMEPRAETICTLAATYEQWSGHDQQALEAYQRCAAEDGSGRFVPHARARIAALGARLGQAPAPQPVAAGPQCLTLAVVWSGVTSTPGCFFFSGPGRLGQRDQLGTSAQWVSSGPQATLTFSGGQVFSGTVAGNQVSLTRTTSYSYQGIWIVTETIQGVLAGNTLGAAYRYQECDARRPLACPGHCTIQAQLTARY